ncbi:DUF3311 domain-containing protein [Streptomyces sp. NPDC049597]|uniref:DUF3311 domain-containing protein n=1 Tax=Streptomyces sp. NPDC049597 TaxID=3155276 RepID=UPI00341A88E6
MTFSRIAAAVLLIAPFVAMLWVSSYARTGPDLGGAPFFYWYQLLWIPITAASILGAYLLLRPDKKKTPKNRERQ